MNQKEAKNRGSRQYLRACARFMLHQQMKEEENKPHIFHTCSNFCLEQSNGAPRHNTWEKKREKINRIKYNETFIYTCIVKLIEIIIIH